MRNVVLGAYPRLKCADRPVSYNGQSRGTRFYCIGPILDLGAVSQNFVSVNRRYAKINRNFHYETYKWSGTVVSVKINRLSDSQEILFRFSLTFLLFIKKTS